ncbi:MAG TPA: BatA domain-containing protein [Lacipirellulaceae bacterium]|jgi:hypothetical protein|nr:BatA domain-containing protein [Lacipirellulaceae bacterium]
MSFLNIAFLLALPLVAVPVALHLYRGRQKDIVPWGAMQFLSAAMIKGRRIERLEELLLLALRFLAVAALVLALAQPMIRSRWLGDPTEREVVLVLDNSLSMSREIDDHSVASQMKEKALAFIDSLSGKEGVQILSAVGNEWATTSAIAADSGGKRQLREVVEAADPTEGSANLLECLQEAVNLHAAQQLSGRRIVVFTDSQEQSWQTDSSAAWQQLAANRDAAPFPIEIDVVECGPTTAKLDNLAVTGIESETLLIRPGDQVDFGANIQNTGDIATPATIVKWILADKVVHESPVGPLAPHAKTPVKATIHFTDPGIHELTCRLERRDQIPLDQENSLVLEVADQYPVLFVQTSDNAGSGVGAPEFFAAALGFKDKQTQPWHSIFRPTAVPPAALETLPLTNYRAIIINNLGGLKGATIERVNAYVRAGGGLWIALGDEVSREEFNRDWFSDGDGLSPVELGPLEVIDKADDVAATIHPPSRDHRATAQLANTTQLDIDEARIHQRWQFADRKVGRDPISILLESGNGRPLVVEKFSGHGRVLVQAFPLDLEWSNVPLLKSYVVMVHDWLGYITAPKLANYNLSPGAQIAAIAPRDVTGATASIGTPRGREISLVAIDSELSPSYRYTQTLVPGTYRVRFTGGDAGKTDVPFHVIRDPRESELRQLSETQRSCLLVPAGLRFGPDVAPGVSTTKTEPRREPFWGILLAALVVLLAGELLMSSRLARLRSGLAVNTV